jgi:hypothetical protein
VDLDDELRRLFADERLDVPVRPEADRVIVAGARRIRRRRAGVVFGGGMLSVATMLAAGTAFGVSGDAPPPAPVAAAESSGLLTTTTPASTTTTTSAAPTTTYTPPTATRVTPPRTTTKTVTTTTATPTKAQPPTSPVVFGPTTVGLLHLGMTADEAMAAGLARPGAQPVDASGCLGFQLTANAAGSGEPPLLFSAKYGLVRIGGVANAETPEGIYVGSTDEDVRAVYPNQAKPDNGSGEWVTPVPGNPNARYRILLTNHVVTDLRLELAAQDCFQ